MLKRRISQLLLWLVVLPFLSATYQPGRLRLYWLAGALQCAIIGTAAFILIKERKHSGVNTEQQRGSWVPASLLLANWAVTSLALNMNDPPRGQAWLNTTADQQLRYYALVAGGAIALGGLALLAARLYEAGEKTFSVLAFTAGALSDVLFTLMFLVYPHLATARGR